MLALDQIDQIIDDVVSDIDYVYNKSANNTAVHIKSIVNDLRYSIQRSIKDLDGMITKQQFYALENLLVVKEEFDEMTRNRMEEFQNITITAGQILSDLPFTKNEARITKPDIGIFVKEFSNNLPISLIGYNLDNKDNSIAIGDSTVFPSNQTSTNLEFLLGKDLINENLILIKDTVNYMIGKLNLYSRRGLFGQLFKKELPISFKILPRQIGVVQVIYEIDSLVRNPETVVGTNCAKGTRGTPSSGRRREESISCHIEAPTKIFENCGEVQGIIVNGSITFDVTANRHGGGRSLGNVSARSFVVNVTAHNQRRRWGGGGLYGVTPRYRVEYPCRIRAEKRSQRLPLLIGNELPYDLGSLKDPSLKRVEITLFDGSEVVLTNQTRKKPTTSVEYNDDNKQVVIRALEVER